MITENYMICKMLDKSRYKLIKEEYNDEKDRYFYHCLDIKSYHTKIFSQNFFLRGYPIIDIIRENKEMRTINSEDMERLIPEWYITINSMENRFLYYFNLPIFNDEDMSWRKGLIPIFNSFRKRCTSGRVETYVNDNAFEDDPNLRSLKKVLWRFWFFSKEMGYHNIGIKYQYRIKGEGIVHVFVDGKPV